MRDSKIALLRNAIENTKQIQAIVRDLPRVFCPHILGIRNGHWYVVVWQFEGYSNSGDLPNWRYFELNELSKIQIRDGPWHSGPLRRRRRRTFPMDRVDSIADPDHIGHVSAQRSGFSLSRMLFGLASNRLGRLPKKRPSLLSNVQDFAAKSPELCSRRHLSIAGVQAERTRRVPLKRKSAMGEPHVVSDLRDKRAEISGMIADLEKELGRQRADLARVDTTLWPLAVASHGLAPGGNGGSSLNSGHTRKSAR